MKKPALMFCLILLFLSSSAQSIPITEKSGCTLTNDLKKTGYILINAFQVRSILQDHAELVILREQYKTDSSQIAALTQAYYFKGEALKQSELATSEAMGQAQDWHESYTIMDKKVTGLQKEVKKQKRLKWLFLGIGVVAVILR